MRNFSMAACLLLGACLHLAPSPDHRLVTVKPKLMSADYRGDLDELARLREEVLPLASNPALGYLAHYWAGFASWRIAINGANQGMSVPDLIANLEKAAANFETSIRLKDDFADGYAAAASVNGWLGAFDMRNNPSETPERIKKFWSLLARATDLEPDNPRVLWVKAVPLLVLPPDKGGNLKGAIELYRRMDEVSQAKSDTGSPLPDWGKPEALMSLAFAHLQQSDLTSAREEAQAALRLQPDWSYVRDILVPQIEAAQSK
ncbi:MAG: hypothetical protein ACJ76J_10605 [Thermoanaerobaculia bacterium]